MLFSRINRVLLIIIPDKPRIPSYVITARSNGIRDHQAHLRLRAIYKPWSLRLRLEAGVIFRNYTKC